MLKNILKYRNIYIFIITLSIIGFISGISYYQLQSSSTKEEIKEKISIKEELSTRINNIPKSLNTNITIFLLSLTIILIVINILNIFLKPFQIGFIFSFLLSYKTKFSLLYTSIYYLIPFIFTLILTRISITITISIIRYLLTKDIKIKKELKRTIKKYFLICSIELLYQVIIFLISPNINSYLMTIL